MSPSQVSQKNAVNTKALPTNSPANSKVPSEIGKPSMPESAGKGYQIVMENKQRPKQEMLSNQELRQTITT